MKREIKFRAWDESQKYMAYQGTPDLEDIQSFIHHFGDKKLLQYTGFLDINGKEIYEGDILKKGKYKYFVIFLDGAFICFHLELKDWDGSHLRWGGIWRFKELNFEIEVIGNIYEK